MTDEYLALTNARTLESGTMERAVEFWVAIQLLIIGLSHLLQPRVWVDFMIRLRGWGHAGVFVNGMLSLSFGAVIVAGHQSDKAADLYRTALAAGEKFAEQGHAG